MIVPVVEYICKSYFKFDISFSVVVRGFFSLLTSWLISLLVGPYLIFYLKKLNICQIIRNTGPKSHFFKKNTPTMGGIMIVFSIILSILLWANLSNRYIWYVIFILVSYGIIGFFDDYYKIIRKNSCGLNILSKYCLLSMIAFFLMIVIFFIERNVIGTQLIIPYFKNITFQLGIFYIFLGYLVIVGTSNAVNLSDGLDGLVIMSIIFISFGLGLMALIFSNVYCFSWCLDKTNCVLFEELVIVCSAVIGSSLGFLWFNVYPAQIFMGDIGSLSLGGVLGVIAILLRQEILFLIMSAVFVVETLSVILQIFFFKIFGFRIFLMAPIHHHFELKGYPESRIVVRFWIITLILVLIALVSLKV